MWVILAGAVASAFTLELVLELNHPLWIDEAWTLGVISQKSWPDFFWQVYSDSNAPLHYFIMHLWQAWFGLSNISLRIPSLFFAAAGPLLIAFWPADSLPAEKRLAWAALSALWYPSLAFAGEARGYEMLFFFSSLQCLAYIRLLASPSTSRATVWALFAAAAILTHYDAVLTGGMQGVLYLIVHRAKAVRTWPAALVFLPAFGWLSYHLPRVLMFARPEALWYPPLTLANIYVVPTFLTGGVIQLAILFVVFAVALALGVASRSGKKLYWPAAQLWLPVLASALATAVLAGMGFLRPTFSARYLTPDAPGILLGFVLAIGVVARSRFIIASTAVILGFLAAGAWKLSHPGTLVPAAFNYEIASKALERSHPKHIVFLWDNPLNTIMHPEQLDAAGGAFFRRDGEQVWVDPVALKPGEDPNSRLLVEAKPPGSAILWLYDAAVARTAAVRKPPQINRLDPAWDCRQFGSGTFGVYACSFRGNRADGRRVPAHSVSEGRP